VEFPTIEGSSRHRCKSKGVQFLIDPSAKRFQRRSERATIPFKEIEREEVKLKTVPIKLHWPSHDGAEELTPLA
jgi:3-polyprenyl-4-hydroxybenzoate decarboxylase